VKKLVTMTLLLVAVAAPAAAQAPGSNQQPDFKPNVFGEGMHLKTDVEVKEQQEKERAYKAGMSKIPDQKAKVDPWGNVRATPPSATAQRPAAK